MTRSRKLIAAIGLATLVVFPRLWAAQSRAEVDLRAAIEMETVKGDLKAAIDLFSKLVQNTDRAVAAKALIRMGQCYEKLGTAQTQEAQKAYERAIRDFADQKEAVATARTRLDALNASGTSSSGEPRARLLLDRFYRADIGGNATRDGRYTVTGTGTDERTGFSIRDLQTGQVRKVADKVGDKEGPGSWDETLISPDGSQISFNWWRRQGVSAWQYQLRLIGADGKGERQLYPKAGWTDYFIEPCSWSLDGQWIAVTLSTEAGRRYGNEILLVSTSDGQTRRLPTPSAKKWGIYVIHFSPDGKWLAYTSESARNPGKSSGLYILPTDGSAKEETELAADAHSMGWTPDGSGVLFTRARNGMNSLYLQPVSQGKAAGQEQQIHNAFAVGNRSLGITPQGSLLHATLNLQTEAWIVEIDTHSGRLGVPVFRAEVPRLDLVEASRGNSKFSPDGTRWLCALPPKAILVRYIDRATEHTIKPQMAQMNRIEWSGDSQFILISGDGTDGKSGIYRVDPSSGTASLLTDIAPGRAFASSRDSGTIYYSDPQRKAVMARNLANGGDRLIVAKEDVNLANLRLSRDGKRLAVGGGKYLGVVDLATQELKDIYNTQAWGPFWSLDWSGDDRRLVTLKSRASFSKLNDEIWIFPSEGGEPVKQPLPGLFAGLSISSDGNYAGILHLEHHGQIWVLENFLPKAKNR